MPDNSLGYDLVWHRLGLHLQCVKAEGRKAHPISVLEAIVKGAHQASGLDEAGVRVMFRVPGTRVHQIRISRSRSLRVEILLFTDQTDLADRWLESAGRYFDPKSPGRNFRVVRQEIPEIESFSRLLEEHSAGPVIDSEAALPPDEICLDFLTPLPFEPTAGHPRTWIDKERLLKTMVDRLRRLPGGVPSSLLRLDPPTPIPAYWTYQQIEHDSKSQPGHPKYLNGCTGPLLLRGSELDRWLPWLRLFERIGLGKQVSFGQGQFRLWPRSVPVLDAALLDPNQISLSIEALIQRDPDLLLHAADGPDMLSREELAHRLVAELREGWKPGVFRRVQVQREGKGARKRVLEIPTARDRIVYAHLLRLLAAPMDCLFSTASIGYRKGKSRDDAVAQVRAAIAAGCTHVVESDIADFFPSVNLARLLRTLDDVLPHRDHRLRSTLEAAILMPPSGDSGESGLKPRTHGLPIGTALSPLLANLYLNAFDHELRAAWSGAHLIRYADDFIVLTQSEAIAQDLLQQAEAAASRLDLALNIDKTQIRALAEGFEFLGIRFSAESGSEEWLDERPTSLRKLLYVTEPYAFVGLQQGSVVIRAGDTHLGSYPLSRTGGIVTLAPCTLSTQLIARIADLGIPLAIAGGSGRQIATVAGDTASRFAVSAAQAQKFSSLGDPGVCRIAADIVDAKLTNYVALVQQRGVPGTADLVRHLEAGRAALMQAATLDEVRGIEGDGARSCFPFIAGWIQQPGFPWEGRRRHGERPDRLNSLFNLGYHLLFTRINALLRVLGVNPYLGFLHAPNTRYEALTCDLQEPFRPYIDRLVIRLINLRVIGENDFHETDEGFWLTRSARAAFLQQFARELDRRPTKHRPSLAEILEAQAHGIGAWIRHDRPLNFHRWSGHDD